jgi:hypothetical protein
MNLKAKLYILKNYTLLLLGPSPFEQWCESYSCFTVGSLHFSKIAVGSSFVYLSLPLLCVSSAARRRHCPAMCAALPPLRCPSPSPVPLPHLPRRSPALALASPCLATPPASCPSCTPPPLAVAAPLAPPPAF